MKLNSVLESLSETKFLNDKSCVQIVVTKGKSLRRDDQIFECYLPVPVAKHFFGELEVVVNKIEPHGSYQIPTFWFLLAYEGE